MNWVIIDSGNCFVAYVAPSLEQWWLIVNEPLKILRPRQNGRDFADDVLKWIFLNENVWILIKISLKFVPKGLINKIRALVQMMVWRHPADTPLSEPMVVSVLTYITRPQWIYKQNTKNGHSWKRLYMPSAKRQPSCTGVNGPAVPRSSGDPDTPGPRTSRGSARLVLGPGVSRSPLVLGPEVTPQD